MSINATKAIREIVAETPSSVSVLEQLGIDYCCGRDQPLEAACRQRGLSLQEVVSRLEASAAAPPLRTAGERDWNRAPLADLIAHIISQHHQFTRLTLQELGPLLEKVCATHGGKHPELRAIDRAVKELEQELTCHMWKEEQILFPGITEMEEAARNRRPSPSLPFGTGENPIQVMPRDHESAGENLKGIRDAAGGYLTPPDACTSYQALYAKLKALEEDLHYHIYLENYLLFPRALALEKGVSQ